MAAYDGTASRVGPTWNTVGTSRVVWTWYADHIRGSLGGGTVVDSTWDNDLNLGASVAIGNDAGSGTQSVDGNIKNLRIWNRAFTDAELQSITQ